MREQTKRLYGDREVLLRSPEGKVVVCKIQADFCKENNLTKSALCNVIKGTVQHHKGWRLYLPQQQLTNAV